MSIGTTSLHMSGPAASRMASALREIYLLAYRQDDRRIADLAFNALASVPGAPAMLAEAAPTACGCGGHHPSTLCGYGADAALDERSGPILTLPTLGGEALGCSIRGREPREASVALDGHLTDGMRDEEGWHITDRKPTTARPVEMGAAWSPVRPGVAAMCGYPLADGRYRPVIGPGMAADAACGEPAGYGMPPAEAGGELDGEA